MTGTLYIISAPSGGGKTSLVRALINTMPNLFISISHTTRPARPGEQEGINYHFVSEEQFNQLLSQQIFLEYAKVFDHFYATSRAWVEQQLQKNHDVILEIDWQGAQQIKQHFTQYISIFILPPSLDQLRSRLLARAQDDHEVIEQRMAKARAEMSHYHEFDYVIINDVFESALQDLQAIIRSKRLQLVCQQNAHAELIKKLLND